MVIYTWKERRGTTQKKRGKKKGTVNYLAGNLVPQNEGIGIGIGRERERQKEGMFCSITTAAVVDAAGVNLVEEKSTVEAFFIFNIFIFLIF